MEGKMECVRNFSLEGFGMKGKRMVRKEVHKATEISNQKRFENR